MSPEYRTLMVRYAKLGSLLPTGDDTALTTALDDPATKVDATLILAEMRQVEAEIAALLKVARAGARSR